MPFRSKPIRYEPYQSDNETVGIATEATLRAILDELRKPKIELIVDDAITSYTVDASKYSALVVYSDGEITASASDGTVLANGASPLVVPVFDTQITVATSGTKLRIVGVR